MASQQHRGDRSELALWLDSNLDSINIDQEHRDEDPNVHKTLKRNILEAEMQLRLLGATLTTNLEAPPEAQQVQIQCLEEIAKSPSHPAQSLCQKLCTEVTLPPSSKKKKSNFTERASKRGYIDLQPRVKKVPLH